MPLILLSIAESRVNIVVKKTVVIQWKLCTQNITAFDLRHMKRL